MSEQPDPTDVRHRDIADYVSAAIILSIPVSLVIAVSGVVLLTFTGHITIPVTGTVDVGVLAREAVGPLLFLFSGLVLLAALELWGRKRLKGAVKFMEDFGK